MDFDEKDNEVIQLLTQLRSAEGGYPADLLAVRRQNYIKQIAAFGVGAGAAGVLHAAAKGGGGPAVPPAAGTLLEAVLIVAIIVEAGAVALINRDRVTDLFRTMTTEPQVQEIRSPAEIPSSVAEIVPTNTALVTGTFTFTATPIGTPSPALLLSTAVAGEEENDSQAASTPNDNNGNHYGQTPQPERTKEPREPGNGNRRPGNQPRNP